jgi:hypothetical protein
VVELFRAFVGYRHVCCTPSKNHICVRLKRKKVIQNVAFHESVRPDSSSQSCGNKFWKVSRDRNGYATWADSKYMFMNDIASDFEGRVVDEM